MKSELDLINQAEAYLRGELSPEERIDFEKLRQEDPLADQKVVSHFNMMNQLSEYGKQRKLMADMADIHSQLDIAAIRSEVIPQSVVVKRLWAKHRFNLGIAASVAILAVLSTLLSSGYFSKNPPYQEMVNHIIKQDGKINNLENHIKNRPSNPGNYGGTGFAFASNFIVSNYHVVRGADSVYIQNSEGDYFKVKTVYTDIQNDIAVLEVIDPSFKPFTSLPYTIKKTSSDLGEEVFTIGFPRDDSESVLGKGYLSSHTGNKGDTTSYQVTIPINPGNSGSPLLDYKGNIIGIIKGKDVQRDGAVFATRSDFLLKAIDSLSEDSLKPALVSKKNSLSRLSRMDQISQMQDYIFVVKAYKK